MKKILLVLMLTVSAGLFAWDGGFHIPCYRCKELTTTVHRGYSYCLGCPMWRCYEEEGNPKNKGFMVYRCSHGHKILIPKSSDKRTRDMNEILVEDRDGKRTQLSTVSEK